MDKNSQYSYDPSKYEILNEILLTEGKNLISKHFKHPELLGQSMSVSINPFNPSDYEYLLSAFLGGPSHLGRFNTEKLEGILKKLLQDDYDGYYEAAKKRIIARNKTGLGIASGNRGIIPRRKSKVHSILEVASINVAGVRIWWYLLFLSFLVAVYQLYDHILKYW